MRSIIITLQFFVLMIWVIVMMVDLTDFNQVITLAIGGCIAVIFGWINFYFKKILL